MLYDTKITKKKKGQKIPNLKKKKSTKILTRHTFEYFTQKNDANSIQILWLKMKIYMSAPRDKISLISILIHVCVLALIEGRKKRKTRIQSKSDI